MTCRGSNRTALLAVGLIVLFSSGLLAGCNFNLEPIELHVKASTSPTISQTLISAAQGKTISPQDISPQTSPQPGDAPVQTQALTNPESDPNLGGLITATITAWPNDTPTPGPSPTPSRTATRTLVPTRTRAPSLTPTITSTPTVTATATPPAPDHDLVQPGMMSLVTSPIQMEFYSLTGDDGQVHIRLVGEDGRTITETKLNYDRGGRYIYAAPKIPFEIEAVSEVARLEVWSQDSFGRTIALSSVDLVLLSIGRSEINPEAVAQEPYIIRAPRYDQTIKGGTLIVDGLARPVNQSALIFEVITEGAQVITSKTFTPAAPPAGQSYTPFHLEIPYQIKTTTPVRLIVRQEGSRLPGTVWLNSILITLEP